MSVIFPGEQWIPLYKAQIDASAAYREAARTWVYGPVALIVGAEPERGVAEDFAVWLDLDRGLCSDARRVTPEEALAAPFVITAPYSRWKQVILRELDPIKGMMQGKLRLRGDLPTVVRHVRAAQELVTCAASVPGAVFAEDAAA